LGSVSPVNYSYVVHSMVQAGLKVFVDSCRCSCYGIGPLVKMSERRPKRAQREKLKMLLMRWMWQERYLFGLRGM
jgi:hypothetical protein